MCESDHPRETMWLYRVLETLMEFQRSRRGLDELRDRLTPLAWAEGVPEAASFAEGENRFRRHPLASVEAIGCSALLMYWPPGHATLPHDHGGLWGIEVVLDGALDVEEYVRSGSADAPALTYARSLSLRTGDSAMFASRDYVHRCRNLSNVAPTLTLHVYGGVLDTYTSFDRDAAGRLGAYVQVARSDRTLS